MDETDLAWALARVADPYLNAQERNDLYVAIGVGETYQAIGSLLAAVVRHGLHLHRMWLWRLRIG